MTPLSPFEAHWPAISALLDEALGLPAPERAGWLDGLAGERASHREALRALLVHQAEVETDDFLNALPQMDTADAASPLSRPAAGSSVGAYRLIEEIGQGGMGTVWLAERADGLMNRRVALKLPRIVWGEAFAERLAREREILATLEHEHIARLYDAGIDAHGRPFLAMELIAGEPIDVFCRERQLPLAERIDLLLQVMAAVAHAHARLVVHRDLKPNNILVSADARVSLLDFGIAKLLEGELSEETTLTRAGGHALTPDYASPEQIRGEPLGTASDIYSLAVVAYELLAGGRPYRLKHANAAELAQAIAEAKVPLVSEAAVDKALRRQLQGDLDAILNKALKTRPDERYVSMDAFAQDLQHWRDGKPVQARPDSLAYRTAKFAGRYRLQVAAGSVVAAALVAGATIALWQAHKATIEAQRAQLANRFVANLFAQNDPDASQGRQLTGAEMLQTGAEKLDTEFKDQPEALADLHLLVGKIYVSMSLPDEARKHLDSALTLFRRLGDTPSALDVLAARGEVAALDGDAVKERQLAQAGIDEAQRYAGDQNRWHAAFSALLAEAAWTEGRFDEAERGFVDTLRREAKLHGERSKEWLDAQDKLALVYIQTGRLVQAREALAQADRIGSTTPGVPTSRLLGISYDLALLRGMLGDLVGEEADLRRVVPSFERHLGPLHRETLNNKSEWSRVLAELGRYDAALTLSREVLRLLPQSHVSEDVQPVLRSIAAWVHWSAGHTAEGLPIALEADRYFQSSAGALRWSAVVSKRVAGDLLLAADRSPEALSMLQRAATGGAALKGAQQSPRYARVLMSLGLAYRANHQLASAESTMTQACSIQTAVMGSDQSPPLRCQAFLAWIRAERASGADTAGALAALSAARLAVERSLPPEHPLGAELLEAQAELLDASGKAIDARPLHAAAQQRYRAAVGADLPHGLTLLH